ncbi:MAG: Gfo/Idh/MocA family oxidoreductase [Armatimonadia bacterium]
MSPKSLGFGIVGCGLISQFHGNAIKAAAGAELIAATDPQAERLDKFCADFGCESAASFEALLEDPRIDVVNILTPNAMHAQFAIPAMDAGKHVVIEKPPDMTLDKVDAMIAARDRNGVKVAISLQVRFRKPIQAMYNAIQSGRFGKLYYAGAHMKWFRDTAYYLSDDWRSKRDQGAGVTIQHAFHYIDLLHHLMGEAQGVEARMFNVAHPEVQLEDTLQAFIDWENGGKGIVEASTALWPGTDIRIEINGENGTAIMQGERVTTWKFRDEQPGDAEMLQVGSAAQTTAAGGAADFAFTEHMYMIEDMVKAINEGKDPWVTLEKARGSLEIALAMYKSADDGCKVSLPL